jgi:hypothetical protein
MSLNVVAWELAILPKWLSKGAINRNGTSSTTKMRVDAETRARKASMSATIDARHFTRGVNESASLEPMITTMAA